MGKFREINYSYFNCLWNYRKNEPNIVAKLGETKNFYHFIFFEVTKVERFRSDEKRAGSKQKQEKFHLSEKKITENVFSSTKIIEFTRPSPSFYISETFIEVLEPLEEASEDKIVAGKEENVSEFGFCYVFWAHRRSDFTFEQKKPSNLRSNWRLIFWSTGQLVWIDAKKHKLKVNSEKDVRNKIEE